MVLEKSIRPWGKYEKYFQENGIWIKRVEVNPNSRLSLQKHKHRTERWLFLQGKGLAIVDDQEINVGPNSIVDIPLGAVHRICNVSENELLVFIEIARGEILTEEDIIRIQDDYHREGK